MNIRNQERVMYLNYESGKRLPFNNKFKSFNLIDPEQTFEALNVVKNSNNYDTVIIDSLTFMMDMYETVHVITAPDTMQAWGRFSQYFKKLMQEYVAGLDKSVIFTAHTLSILNEDNMSMETYVPIKGALKNNGIESYFSTVVSTKKVSLKELENYQSDLLTITDRDRMLGYKHVFQTQLTKETINERIRSPIGMFSIEETYMNNDAQMLLDRLSSYYKN